MPKGTPLVVAVAVVASSLVTASLCFLWHRQKSHELSSDLHRKRQEERTGRIRAEVKLRNALARQKQLTVSTGNFTSDPHMMNLSTIGTVVSAYTKRMGTPRQGMLVPSSRGFIQFSPTLSPESVDGIDGYSHIWVIFAFHENTSLATSKKTKIRPPRAGGIKVGQLATRSPHRPNALGLSLVKMERWEPALRRLHISALDLVNGTPVYDIKPYVHWDIPREVSYDASNLRVPKWVERKDDVLQQVEVTEKAKEMLAKFHKNNELAPLYGNKDPTALQAAIHTLTEILAQDPRSSHKGVSHNQRGSVSSETYRLLFCRVEVEFLVDDSGAKVVGIHKASAPDSQAADNEDESSWA